MAGLRLCGGQTDGWILRSFLRDINLGGQFFFATLWTLLRGFSNKKVL